MGTTKETFGTRTEFTTSATNLASEIRTNFNSSNPLLYSFVTDKALQLIETPTMQPKVESLSFSTPYSFEIFHYNSITSFTTSDNLFAYYMIPMLHKPCLVAYGNIYNGGNGIPPTNKNV